MEQEEVERILKNFGVNPKLKGFDLLVKLILYIIDDIENNKTTSKTYNMKDYFYKISVDFDVKLTCIPANIQTAVKSNLYGSGLTPKNAIDVVLKRYEWKKERGNI